MAVCVSKVLATQMYQLRSNVPLREVDAEQLEVVADEEHHTKQTIHVVGRECALWV